MNIVHITEDDLCKIQVAQEVKEKNSLYNKVTELNTKNETLQAQIVLFKDELKDMAKLCKLLDSTNYLTNISEEQMKEVKDIVEINKVIDWFDKLISLWYY